MPVLRNLKSHLLSITRDSITEAELTEFVHLSHSIVQAYLQHIRGSVSTLCDQQGITITDLAYDCVAEAFGKGPEGDFRQLQNFMSSLDLDIGKIPDYQLLLAFRSFITRIADAQLARLFALSDPIGAKIHRNIKHALKTHSQFVLIKRSQGLVLRTANCEPLEECQSFPIDELKRSIFASNADDATVPDLLNVLHSTLTDQANYCRSVVLQDIVQIFKEYYSLDHVQISDSGEDASLPTLNESESEQICNQALLSLKEKVLMTYLIKDKLSKPQAEAIVNAFQDMLLDWRSTGTEDPSLFDYLRRHLTLDFETFQRDLYPKMTYLLKFVKSDLASRLIRDL